jgi:nitric oxide reductase large subunit
MRETLPKMNQYIVFVVGVLLFILGIFIFTRSLAVNDMRLWLPAALVLAGILILPGVSKGASDEQKSNSAILIIALILLCIGGYLLLRISGVFTIPVLQYLLGGGLSLSGLYGMISSTIRLLRSSKDVE